MRRLILAAVVTGALAGGVACYNHNGPGPNGPNDPDDPTRPPPPFSMGPTYPYSPLTPAPMRAKPARDAGADSARD